MEKKLIIFMPSIEGGGIEKNLFIISNYLSTQLKGITLITISKKYNHLFKNIKIINAKSNFWNNFNRRVKYIICLIILIKIFLIFSKDSLCFFLISITGPISTSFCNKN